jgi:hypothetical protein
MGDGMFSLLVSIVGIEGEQGKRIRRTRHAVVMK